MGLPLVAIIVALFFENTMDELSQKISRGRFKHNQYDGIIIGAGAGGLVCGCYLAKAGMKVLIIEKNHQVGGYCCSFYRDGALFDACVDTLEACSPGNTLDIIMKDLQLDNKIEMLDSTPSRAIITEKYRINIYRDIDSTVDSISQYYFKERDNIKKFFVYIRDTPYLKIVAKLKKITLNNFLKYSFKDKDLIELISFMIFETSALPPKKISALASAMVFKYFFLDSGYYPKMGMQKFSSSLADTFKKHGGRIILNEEVRKILSTNNSVNGVETKTGRFVSDTIISNADLWHTMVDLIDSKYKSSFLSKLEPSLSAFVVYTILKDNEFSLPPFVRFFHTKRKAKDLYNDILHKKRRINYLSCFANTFHMSSSGIPLTLVNWARYDNRYFWDRSKSVFAENMINYFCSSSGLKREKIELKDIATPCTFKKWNHSCMGNSLGWSSLVDQVFPNFNLPIHTQGLYFVGQSLGKGFGIATMAYLAKELSQKLIRRNKRLRISRL